MLPQGGWQGCCREDKGAAGARREGGGRRRESTRPSPRLARPLRASRASGDLTSRRPEGRRRRGQCRADPLRIDPRWLPPRLPTTSLPPPSVSSGEFRPSPQPPDCFPGNVGGFSATHYGA